MAKIIHYKNPIDSSQVETLETAVTIRQALNRLGIENDELGVSINGKYPIDLDLDYKPSDSDVIEIRHAVHGGGNSETKSTLATVVQLAALVAITVLSGGGASPLLLGALAIGGSVASAALMKWSRDLAMAGMQSGSSESDSDTSTNSYSLTSTANEARPGRPVQILLGKHRIVPDIQTDALRFAYGYDFIPTVSNTPVSNTFYPGITASNGPNSANNNWISMPKNYIEPGFPQYDIKIAPYGLGVPNGPLTTAQNTELCDKISWQYISSNRNPSHINWNYSGINSGEFFPLVIYHSDSTDPLYEKYDLFHFMARIFETGTPYSNLTSLHSGGYGLIEYSNQEYHNAEPNPSYYSNQAYIKSGGLFHDTSRSIWNSGSPFSVVAIESDEVPVSNTLSSLNNKNMTSAPYRTLLNIIGAYYYPTSIPNSITVQNFYAQFGTWLTNTLNGGVSHGGTTSFAIERAYIVSSYGPFTQENKLASTQVFNYGIGDLTISNRKIENTDIGVDGYFFDGISIKETHANGAAFEQYTAQDGPLAQQSQYVVPYIKNSVECGMVSVSANVKRYDSKKLTCSAGYPTNPISLSDNNDYNFLKYKGRVNQNAFRFTIQGSLYATSSSGFSNNTCRLEVQYRASNSENWMPYEQIGIIDITNNTSKKISINIQYPGFFIFSSTLPAGESYELRIRKVTPDSSTNGANQVCELYVTDVSFFTHWYATRIYRDNDCTIPSVLEGLLVTSNLIDSGQTNKYSAFAEAKCWVFNQATSTWSWTKTENPAWWFLYFARGGFTNRSSQASAPYAYPYSPTNGWQNYPGHPSNEYHVFGAGLTDDKIDLDKIKQWAIFCDSKSLTCNMIVKDDTSVNDILERIANTGRGSVTYYKGILSVNYEDGAQIPTCMFGMGNIKADSFSVEYLISDMPRRVKGNYIDSSTWESEQVSALVPFSSADNLKEVEVNLEGVTSASLAQRAVNILAARQYYQRRTYKWSVDIEGLLAKRGDLVYLSHDSTQYGYSGRVSRFNIVSGNVVSIETQSSLDSDIQYITIRDPQNDMMVYECHVENNKIVFDENYPTSKAPFYYSDGLENSISLWANSIPEDFIFIAGAKETPGKIVRISSIEASDDYTFNITAVDEDPAMWALEYDNIIPDESMDDSELVLEISQLHYKILGNGLVRFYWNGPEFIQIINLSNNQPVEANGAFSFTGNEVVIELQAGYKYELEIKPFSIGTPYKAISKKVTLWA